MAWDHCVGGSVSDEAGVGAKSDREREESLVERGVAIDGYDKIHNILCGIAYRLDNIKNRLDNIENILNDNQK